ncbi:MAG: GDYXXLXY domain-containing protein [Cyanobacteria bacterium]|nr:GDYXXLXY domain-containing protein [Cyanobacteriota bacterium]MDW8201423.1 GDYXXLXY domain-containing protein [Cyanobacteriota bacterium SKYGB_h_bin112]
MTTHIPPVQASHSPSPNLSVPAWRFWLPLLLQLGLIAAVPAQDAYTYVWGKTVILQTVPVDPYDFLRGYSQTLSYDISNPTNLKQLPGWQAIDANSSRRNQPFYLVLEAPPTANVTPPIPWKPVRVSVERPTNLPANQVALRGSYRDWRVEYGLETYYMPADRRHEINAEISRGQQNARFSQSDDRRLQAFVVEVKVDDRGNAVPVSLWLDDQSYRF